MAFTTLDNLTERLDGLLRRSVTYAVAGALNATASRNAHLAANRWDEVARLLHDGARTAEQLAGMLHAEGTDLYDLVCADRPTTPAVWRDAARHAEDILGTLAARIAWSDVVDSDARIRGTLAGSDRAISLMYQRSEPRAEALYAAVDCPIDDECDGDAWGVIKSVGGLVQAVGEGTSSAGEFCDLHEHGQRIEKVAYSEGHSAR